MIYYHQFKQEVISIAIVARLKGDRWMKLTWMARKWVEDDCWKERAERMAEFVDCWTVRERSFVM